MSFSRRFRFLCFLSLIALGQQACSGAPIDNQLKTANEATAPSGTGEYLEFAFSEKHWAIRIPQDGLALKVLRKNSDEKYLLGEYAAQNLVISVKMIKVPANPAQKECRDFLWKGEDGSALKKEDKKMSERDGLTMVEYFINEYRGEKIGQKNVNAYFAKDDVCVDVHLSKVNYTEKDAALFYSVLREVAFKDIGDAGSRRFHVSDSNYLEIKVPARWKTWVQRLEGEQNAGTVVTAVSPEGEGVFVQIQVFGAAPDKKIESGPEVMRSIVEKMKENIGGVEAEAKAELQDFRGESSVGSFYTIENPLKAENETAFKYLTRGAATTGDLLAIFTILVKDKDSVNLRTALEMAKSFGHVIIADEKP